MPHRCLLWRLSLGLVLEILRGIRMPFRLPTFNLTANVWRLGGGGGTYAAPNVVTPANLSPGRRVGLTLGFIDTPYMELLLPKLTDIRAAWNSHGADLVECPAGSKRFYTTRGVDDVAKGFANEYRIAWLTYDGQGATTFFGPNSAPEPLP